MEYDGVNVIIYKSYFVCLSTCFRLCRTSQTITPAIRSVLWDSAVPASLSAPRTQSRNVFTLVKSQMLGMLPRYDRRVSGTSCMQFSKKIYSVHVYLGCTVLECHKVFQMCHTLSDHVLQHLEANIDSKYNTIEFVVKKCPIGHKNEVSEDWWSLLTGSISNI